MRVHATTNETQSQQTSHRKDKKPKESTLRGRRRKAPRGANKHVIAHKSDKQAYYQTYMLLNKRARKDVLEGQM